ncbi:hypothetical protein E3N88_24527 [Mikania micrantha]|uniref:Integrase catalytic domain-containing protein n=1 Tax=Mikania micrantha TaxID=192012 RepID=A0A5N6N240_9ASTR|nr:hypothetical protein E3N88_24527 [Mikania micrantha]
MDEAGEEMTFWTTSDHLNSFLPTYAPGRIAPTGRMAPGNQFRGIEVRNYGSSVRQLSDITEPSGTSVGTKPGRLARNLMAAPGILRTAEWPPSEEKKVSFQAVACWFFHHPRKRMKPGEKEMNTLLRNEASSLFFFKAPIRSRSPLLTGSRLISLPLATQMFQFAKFEKSKERRLATELGYGFPIGDPWITDGISPWPFASESVLPSQCPGIHPMHSFRSCTHGAGSSSLLHNSPEQPRSDSLSEPLRRFLTLIAYSKSLIDSRVPYCFDAPIFKGRRKTSYFNDLEMNIRKRIDGWKARHHWIAWDSICQSMKEGGSHVWRNVFPHVSTILGNSHWVVGAGNISLSMANWGAGAFSAQNVDLNTPFREVIQSADFSTLVLPSLSTEAQSILNALPMDDRLRYMGFQMPYQFHFCIRSQQDSLLHLFCQGETASQGSFIFSGCWEIWLARNASVHDSVAMSSSSIINKVKHWCKDLLQLDYPTHSSGFHDSICFQVMHIPMVSPNIPKGKWIKWAPPFGILKLTKSAHFLPIQETYSSDKMVEIYVREVVSRHGVPVTTVSDRDTRFTSRFWRNFLEELGTKLLLSTAYHPQTDGESERTIQTLEDTLRACIIDFGVYLHLYTLSYELSTLRVTPMFPPSVGMLQVCYCNHVFIQALGEVDVAVVETCGNTTNAGKFTFANAKLTGRMSFAKVPSGPRFPP